MDRVIFLLRHEKAAPAGRGADKDRPLSPDGQRDADKLALLMQEHSYAPDIVYCSAAKRTRQTCSPLAEGEHVHIKDTLYLATAGQLFEQIKTVPDTCRSVMLVAHNPGIHSLCLTLAGTAEERLLRYQVNYPPGRLSVLEFGEARWDDLQPGSCRLVDILAGEDIT